MGFFLEKYDIWAFLFSLLYYTHSLSLSLSLCKSLVHSQGFCLHVTVSPFLSSTLLSLSKMLQNLSQTLPSSAQTLFLTPSLITKNSIGHWTQREVGKFYQDPSDEDPPETLKDSGHEFSKRLCCKEA